jgi:GH25 family lysozyme M1 (1,4-beta-N-acetylmuramidase)
MLPPTTIFKYKLALIKAANEGGYLVSGTRAYQRSKTGQIVAIMLLGPYARRTLMEYQRRHGLKPTGILDAPTRAKLIPPAPHPTGPLHGVDVSDYQPTVNYAGLAHGGIRFLVAKASEGHTWTAKTYATHRAGAERAGLAFGAYHFARPTASAADGKAQAQRFLAIAKPRKGELFPTLDLEVSDGVPPAALAAWTRAFVNEVKRECGGCIIYTGPYFWNDNVRSSAFADCPLWIAHYTNGRPTIPTGWATYSLWQYASDGAVPGNTGRFDVDVSNSGGVDHLRI